MPQAISPFVLDSFEPEPPYLSDDGVDYARVRISKTFSGDLVATSTVAMLSVRSAGGGAGYVAIEHVTGTLGGRNGGFALLHAGTMTADEEPWATWPIVPGSGTGGLRGISGESRIEIAPDGAHTLFLDYELPAD